MTLVKHAAVVTWNLQPDFNLTIITDLNPQAKEIGSLSAYARLLSGVPVSSPQLPSSVTLIFVCRPTGGAWATKACVVAEICLIQQPRFYLLYVHLIEVTRGPFLHACLG